MLGLPVLQACIYAIPVPYRPIIFEGRHVKQTDVANCPGYFYRAPRFQSPFLRAVARAIITIISERLGGRPSQERS
jgi:hypothetical protein